jgi:hypothetical protein
MAPRVRRHESHFAGGIGSPDIPSRPIGPLDNDRQARHRFAVRSDRGEHRLLADLARERSHDELLQR